MQRLFIFITCLLLINLTIAQDDTTKIEKRIFQTVQINTEIIVDGHFDEQVWDQVAWQSNFTVQNPNNGEKPQQQTSIKVLYDQHHLYFALRCHHNDITKIENRLARRDYFPGDWIEIHIDSYFDKSTAFSFTTSVSGVKGDEFITDNGNNWDDNWNPIWYNATSIDSAGWNAEVKIPLRQLRFGDKKSHVWGFNVLRRDFSADENSGWQWIPLNASGYVNNFGELHGITGIKPKRQVEIQPYIVGKSVSQNTGDQSGVNVGVDGKIGLTNDMTLDFTINPDFGQVEADPSQLNLNGYRIFFSERRPFFVENSNIFSFNVANAAAGGNFGNDNLFYSRRIGGAPRGTYNHSYQEGAIEKYPRFTSILGSAKVSGKTKNGLAVGLLESITAEEKAKIESNGQQYEHIVEPSTNYLVGSLSQDIKKGESKISLSFTSLNRKLDGTGLEDQYHKSAQSGGLSLFHSWNDREWYLRANILGSRISGTKSMITSTQQSFEHYYQRPDADHLTIDNTKTELTGHGGSFAFGNNGGKDNISFQTALVWASPGLELNDMGFMNTADHINHVTWIGYSSPKPFSIFRNARINLNYYNRWTYGGEHLQQLINTNWHFSLKNFWRFGTGFNIELKDISNKALFGGPLLRQNRGIVNWMYANSDSRKKVNTGLNIVRYRSTGDDKGGLSFDRYSIWASYQPTSALRVSINPNYTAENRAIQNVSYQNYNNQDRYITGRVKFRTFSMSVRANYSLGPNTSIQYWGQPFVSIGNYSEFKYITDPLAQVQIDRYHLYDDSQIVFNSENLEYHVDEESDGIVDYSFGDPDFNFLQFRSNLVFRWEYKPGSELFLVWTQNNTSSGDPSKDILPSLTDDLFSQEAQNVFLLKMTYRFY